jgi:hypothetical protein
VKSWRLGDGSSELDDSYDEILGQLVGMIDHPEQWTTEVKSS